MRPSIPAPGRRVVIGHDEYPLHIGRGLVDRVGALWSVEALGRSVFIVADQGVTTLAERLSASLAAAEFRVTTAFVTPGERSKSLAEVERLARLAAEAGIRRSDTVVAVGGGVIGDLAGFVAASYQRGVRLVHVPTTLLAMVDSAIGGKTGVDLPEGKNYVGAIWQPSLVVVDVDVLETLPARELACGFAEVVKYGILAGEPLWSRVAGWPALPGPGDELVDLIGQCVGQKIAVVVGDERDLGRRAILNLGHTVGHGIEAAAGYGRYHHGEAISLGLLAALRVSEAHLGLEPTWREATRAVLDAHGLPTRLDRDVATDDVLRAMARDKKADSESLNMVLVSAPGHVLTHQNPAREVVVASIQELRA